MRVYRAMSRREFESFLRDFYWTASHDWKGRQVRYKYFATDPGYIVTILNRRTYRNRPTGEAYAVVVEFDIEGHFVEVRELGFVNVALDVTKPFCGKIVRWWGAGEFLREHGGRVLPLMTYYGRKGKVNVYGTREFRNIVLNGDFKKRPYFVRADWWWKFEKLYTMRGSSKNIAAVER
ncbi:hypothetical protein [Pyrococcus kukulkanii]|uniref:Uncharacterized protein n=1 Tax=Pyrococcus kukulkanii TaxID=1609559 RepID=A0ABV4T621_9EURY